GDVVFVDAPTALGIIERFLNAGWWLRPLNEIKGAVPHQWDHCLFVYRAFEATVRDVLNEESGRYTEELRILEDLIGDESHSRVFESINTVFSTYREHLISHRFPPLPQDFGAADLRSTMSRLKDA